MKKQLIIFFVIINFTLACSKKLPEINNVNLVLAISPETKQSIGDEQNQFSIIASQRFSNDILNDVIVDVYSSEAQKILKSLSLNQVFSPSVNVIVPANSSASKSSLILGYPFGLLNQQAVFGGVITGVSNKEDENLGGLKMSDLTPVHVVSVVDAKTNQLVFIGCEENCSESSVQNILLQIPILGIDPVAGLIYLDMSTLGSQLDIVQKMDPTGKDTGLSHKSSNLVLFDFSLNTLVFDVASVMSIANPEGDTGKVPSEVTITTRWYLKLFSGFNPAFQSREHIKEVGFFTTLRSAKPLITRFSSTNYHSSAIAKYYIKNVPERYRSAFSEAFLSWNRKFQASIGRDMFEFEFLEKNDSRFDLIIAGDIRYNVIEWDLVNLAGYGGLGPSIANQFTGETFDANVLIQGPMIETIYKKWFDVSDKIKELKSLGSNQLAEELKVNFTRELNNKIAKAAGIKHAIRLGKTLSFHISSEDQRNHDPLYEPLNFDTIPEGYTYDSYMEGYFIDMLAHELGHNIGLRHNFRGNLASDDSMKLGSVSRSIMEYLSGKFRHLDRLGDYDSMAISYGYAGVKPTHSDWYCTDEDKADARNPKNSAECSSSDATSDPFSYFEGQLDKSIGLLVGKDSTDEPIWKISDLQRQLTESLEGISNYVISAPFTFESWTNFQGKLDRPNDAFLIPQYVLNRLSSKVCSANFDRIVESKNSDKAKKQTLDNIIALQKFVKTLGQAYKVPLNIFTNDQFPCLADK